MSGGHEFEFVPEIILFCGIFASCMILDCFTTKVLMFGFYMLFLCCTFIDLLVLLGITQWVSLEWFTNTCQVLLTAYERVYLLYCIHCYKHFKVCVICYICHLTHELYYYIACLHQKEVSSHHWGKITLDAVV